MNDLSCTPEFWVENHDLCIEKLKDESVWNSIPLINVNELHEFQDNTLVRFYGMIQDMYNPEFYFEQYEVENEVTKEKVMKYGKYRDTTDLSENEIINIGSSRNKTCERHTYVMISFPGLNEWVHNIDRNDFKIVRDNVAETEPKKSLKRPVDEEEPMQSEASNKEAGENSVDGNKRVCVEPNNDSESVLSREHLLNFPLPDPNGKCCHIKVYSNSELLKMNDMMEVVGFLSVNPILTEKTYHNEEEEDDMEVQTHNPPPSLVPRIHCVHFKKLDYYNPLLRHITLNNDSISSLRKDLSVLLTQLLFGDKLAAEYLICHLISSVYLRKDLMALGKFTLNLSNIPFETHENYGEKLYKFLELLVPKSHYLQMTLDNLNDLTFIPKKDYDCNRLTSGILQLSKNTHLVLDETKLQAGQLSSSGWTGVVVLAYTIKNQKVDYDFTFSGMKFDCDIPILILSEGTSLLPSDVHVPLMADEHCINTYSEILQAANHFLKPELLNNLRVYLTKVRHVAYNLSDDVLDLIQDEFVRLRQSNNITADDLHQLLVLARLICLSKGRDTLDEECWHEACQMEVERKTRIVNRPRRTT